MAVIFKSMTRHDRLLLAPVVATAFDDRGAEAYFVAAGFADKTKETAAVTYPEGSVAIDPDTIHGDTGKAVLAPANVKVASNG